MVMSQWQELVLFNNFINRKYYFKTYTEQMENEAIQQNADNSTNDVGDNDDGEPDGENDDKSLF